MHKGIILHGYGWWTWSQNNSKVIRWWSVMKPWRIYRWQLGSPLTGDSFWQWQITSHQWWTCRLYSGASRNWLLKSAEKRDGSRNLGPKIGWTCDVTFHKAMEQLESDFQDYEQAQADWKRLIAEDKAFKPEHVMIRELLFPDCFWVVKIHLPVEQRLHLWFPSPPKGIWTWGFQCILPRKFCRALCLLSGNPSGFLIWW